MWIGVRVLQRPRNAREGGRGVESKLREREEQRETERERGRETERVGKSE